MNPSEVVAHQTETALDLIRVALRNNDQYSSAMSPTGRAELASATLDLIRAVVNADAVRS